MRTERNQELVLLARELALTVDQLPTPTTAREAFALTKVADLARDIEVRSSLIEMGQKDRRELSAIDYCQWIGAISGTLYLLSSLTK